MRSERREVDSTISKCLHDSAVVVGVSLNGRLGHLVGAVDDKRRQIIHAAQAGRLLHGGEQVPDGESALPALIKSFPAPCGDDAEIPLAAKSGSVSPVGPAVRKHEILPLLENGGCAVPEKRMVIDQYIVGFQQMLFVLHVDVEVWIDLVEVVKRHPFQHLHGLFQNPVNA